MHVVRLSAHVKAGADPPAVTREVRIKTCDVCKKNRTRG